MTISKDLFTAILSMDSYNRGYGEGIEQQLTGLIRWLRGRSQLTNTGRAAYYVFTGVKNTLILNQLSR